MTVETVRYTPNIPVELDQMYREALSKVLRWENGTLPAAKQESDLDHVEEALVISHQIEDANPNIANEIYFPTVNDMIYLHDGGEIITGDLCLSNPEYPQVYGCFKKRERAALRYLVGKIDDQATKTKVDTLVRRYHKNDPLDKESLMARLLDKIQALRFGLENVYPAPKSNEEKIHVARAIRIIEVVSEPLSQTLSPDANLELDDLIENEWQRIKKQGFII